MTDDNIQNIQKPDITPIKKFIFGVIFFLLILFFIEFLLSFVGLEKHDHKFMPKSSYPLFVMGKDDMSDYYVTSPHFGTYINNQSFLRDKPVDLTRIFVVGGSAAYGFPATEEYGFSGYLRRALNIAYPGKFEVINAAGMSFGSHRVLDVLKDVILHEPDIVIIYSGNNEYVEQNVLQEVKKTPSNLEKIGSMFDNTDIYRALRFALFKVSPRTFQTQIKQDITDIRSNPRVSRGNIGRSSRTDSTIQENYRKNIKKMIEFLGQHGIDVVVTTVPVDIGGWIPESGLPKFANQNAAQQWIELTNLRDEAFKKGDLALEAEYLRKTLEITPDNPGMSFNYGKVLWMLGRYDLSYQQLVRAKDLDVRPIRALSSFNQVVRNVVDEKNGIFLADLEDKIRELYLQGQGKNIFLDYCHLTETGHKLVAQWLLETISKIITSQKLDIKQLSTLISKDTIVKAKSDFVRGHELYAQALTLENNGRPDLAEQKYLQALTYLPNFDQIFANLGHIYADRKDLRKAIEMYDESIQLNPKSHMSLLSLGYISLQESRYDDAEDFFKKAIAISPSLPGAYGGLGDVYMIRKQFQDAVKYYNESLKLGQDSLWLRKNLAHAYLTLGNKNQAVLNWQEALKFSPFDMEIKELVNKYSQQK